VATVFGPFVEPVAEDGVALAGPSAACTVCLATFPFTMSPYRDRISLVVNSAELLCRLLSVRIDCKSSGTYELSARVSMFCFRKTYLRECVVELYECVYSLDSQKAFVDLWHDRHLAILLLL
jgi:hypothetical protein